MLQTVQKYYRSVLGFVMMFIILVSMLMFGVDFGGGRGSDAYAIKINEQEVPFREFATRRREVEGRLRQQLGENYSQFAAQLLGNMNQNITDSLISEVLYSQFADESDFVVGADQVQQDIIELFPPGQFNVDQYRAFLRNTGMTAQAFENRVAGDALRKQIFDIMEDVSASSEVESMAKLREEKTKYDISYISLSADKEIANVKDPEEDLLKQLHDENAADYEVPAKVSYRFSVIKPEDNVDLVEVLPEDIELYYTENIRKYTVPEQFLVRQIKIDLPKKADKKKSDALRKTADEVLKKIKDGGDFAKLAKEHNKDKTLKKEAGLLGWKKRGDLSSALEAKAFTLRDGGTTEIIEADNALHILSIEDHKEATPKELETVKDEIEKEIRLREAPAYTAAKAEELYAQFVESEKSLEEFANEQKLTTELTKGLLEERSDPNLHRGLTRKVLRTPEQTKQIADVGRNSILVEIVNYEEPHIAPFEEVRDQILKQYKEREANKLVAEKASGLHLALAGEDTLTAIATKEKLTVKNEKGIDDKNLSKVSFLQSSGDSSPLAGAALNKPLGKAPFRNGKEHFIAVVTKITLPEEKELKAEIEKSVESTTSQLATALQLSLRNKLKSQAEIDINQAVFAQ